MSNELKYPLAYYLLNGKYEITSPHNANKATTYYNTQSNDEPFILVKSDKISDYFKAPSHIDTDTEYVSSFSTSHAKTIQDIERYLINKGITNIKFEETIADGLRRIDMLVQNIAIEIQHSSISEQELLKRTLDHYDNGYSTMWIWTSDSKVQKRFRFMGKQIKDEVQFNDFFDNYSNVPYFIDSLEALPSILFNCDKTVTNHKLLIDFTTSNLTQCSMIYNNLLDKIEVSETKINQSNIDSELRINILKNKELMIEAELKIIEDEQIEKLQSKINKKQQELQEIEDEYLEKQQAINLLKGNVDKNLEEYQVTKMKDIDTEIKDINKNMDEYVSSLEDEYNLKKDGYDKELLILETRVKIDTKELTEDAEKQEAIIYKRVNELKTERAKLFLSIKGQKMIQSKVI